MNGRDLEEDIKRYGRRATQGAVSCELDRCPCCHGRPGRFQRHGVRSRLFVVFAAEVIRRVRSYLTRWKCPLCRRTFTVYPAFALAFKRYVLPFLLARGAAYGEDTARTYREGVKEEGQPISHEDADGGAQLWPSTLWRWVGRLGRFPQTVREALNLIQQKDPSTGVFRALGRLGVRAGKYRSQARRRLLLRGRERVAADREYARVFCASVFPDLATRCGFG